MIRNTHPRNYDDLKGKDMFGNLLTWPILVQMISDFNLCKNNSIFFVLFFFSSVEMSFIWKEKVFKDEA